MKQTRNLIYSIIVLCVPVLISASGCDDMKSIKLSVEHPNFCYHSADLFNTTGPLKGEQLASDGILYLDPSRIRRLLLEGDWNLLAAAISAHEAKLSVNSARGSLLPQANLSTMISALGSPSFALTEIEYVVPFLVPSNWFALGQAKEQLDAARLGFLIEDLNEFATAYALSETIQADMQARILSAADLQDALLLERIAFNQKQMGYGTDVDIALADASSQDVRAQLSQLQELINGELASLRKSLGLCNDVRIGLITHHLPESFVELKNLDDAEQEGIARAPEVQQLVHLLEAARQKKLSAIFSFISNVSAVEQGSSSNSNSGPKAHGISDSNNSVNNVSFNIKKLKGEGGIDLGFAYFPNIALANDDEIDVVNQYNGVVGEIKRILESNLTVIDDVQRQIDAFSTKEADLTKTLKTDKTAYEAGAFSLQNLILVQQQLRQAKLSKIRAIEDLDHIRGNVHRVMRTEEFEKVTGCWTPVQVANGVFTGACDDTAFKRKLGIK